MNLSDMIMQLQDDTVRIDENFNKLETALDKYHRLIDEGKLIPRKNNTQSIYTIYSYKSNIMI